MKKMDLIVEEVCSYLRNPCCDCSEEIKKNCKKSNPKLPHRDCAIGYRVVTFLVVLFMPLILFGQILYYGLRRESKCGKQSTPES